MNYMNNAQLALNTATTVAGLVTLVAGLATIESVIDITDVIPEHARLTTGILSGVITFVATNFFRSLLSAQKFSKETAIRSL